MQSSNSWPSQLDERNSLQLVVPYAPHHTKSTCGGASLRSGEAAPTYVVMCSTTKRRSQVKTRRPLAAFLTEAIAARLSFPVLQQQFGNAAEGQSYGTGLGPALTTSDGSGLAPPLSSSSAASLDSSSLIPPCNHRASRRWATNAFATSTI